MGLKFPPVGSGYGQRNQPDSFDQSLPCRKVIPSRYRQLNLEELGPGATPLKRQLGQQRLDQAFQQRDVALQAQGFADQALRDFVAAAPLREIGINVLRAQNLQANETLIEQFFSQFEETARGGSRRVQGRLNRRTRDLEAQVGTVDTEAIIEQSEARFQAVLSQPSQGDREIVDAVQTSGDVATTQAALTRSTIERATQAIVGAIQASGGNADAQTIGQAAARAFDNLSTVESA